MEFATPVNTFAKGYSASLLLEVGGCRIGDLCGEIRGEVEEVVLFVCHVSG